MVESPLSVRVNLRERSYEIRIGSGVLKSAGQVQIGSSPIKRAFIITDDRVESLHAVPVAHSFETAGTQVDTLVVPSGEQSKSTTQADHLWNRLLELGADRQSLIVAVGGGVVGDLAGFIAATYARGLPYLQVPTTLLAQVDSSIGGKVGVNLPHAKNMVGAFWQPAAVLIDTQTLQTLPEREYRSGLAEVVKYGVILDTDFFERLTREAPALLERKSHILNEVIARCCRLKADVVEADEREESGHRAVLNYGHTFAHALEAVAGYGQLLHGEAVSIGMMCAARLAQSLGRVDINFVQRQLALLTALNLPVTSPKLNADQLLAAMLRDKKSKHGQLQFILPTRLGHVELVSSIDVAAVRSALNS
ncbi:MAG TPA: 3-dehydroquinate synthase [Pirellulales bacterium]